MKRVFKTLMNGAKVAVGIIKDGKLIPYLAESTATLQPAPIPNANPHVIDAAIALLKSRKEIGLATYGTPLQTGNGRDFGRDEDEEAADWFIYRTGRRIEQEERIQGLLKIIAEQLGELRQLRAALYRECKKRAEKPDFNTFVDLKYSAAGGVLRMLQAGEISFSKCCEALACLAHSVEPTLPEREFAAIPDDAAPGDIWEKLQAIEGLESRVIEWVRTRIGEDHMSSAERAMRLLEEAIELAQSEGISEAMVRKQAVHVYSRPVGEPLQEAAGVAVCLLGWCGSKGVRFADIAAKEIARIEAKPMHEIRGSLARKFDADLVVAVGCVGDEPAEHVREGEVTA